MNTAGHRLTFQMDTLSPVWRVALIVVGILLSGGIHRALHLDFIPWALFASVFPFLLGSFYLLFTRSWQSPLLPFLSIFFVFISVFIDSFSARSFGFSPKANQLAFLFSFLFAGLYFCRDFKYYWSHWSVRWASIFFVVTFLYFLFHASDFDISRVKYGYVLLITAGLEINSPPVKNIILISSLSIWVATILALSPFKIENEQEKHQLFGMTYTILAVFLVALVLLVLSKGAKWNYGMHYYLPLVMLAGFAFFYLIKRHHSQEMAWSFPMSLKTLFGASLLFSTLFMFLLLNKTSLLGTLLAFILFFTLTRGSGYGDVIRGVWDFASQNVLTKFIIVFLALAALLLASAFGILDLFSAKIDYVVSGLSKNSSMKVREGNWQYFLQDWAQTLDWVHVIFGYGIGASRKSIFYISAMRQSANESNLVQTLHNGYMEYLYDYGLMCLTYFSLYFYFLKKSLASLQARLTRDELVLGAAQLCIIVYVAFYSLTDGIRVQMLIQIFVLLGFLEKLKAYYKAKAIPAPQVACYASGRKN